MGGRLNDMIDLILLESGKIEIETLPTNLEEIIPRMTERFRSQANAKHLVLATNINRNIPTVEIDSSKIDQVFSNLVDNAIKYTNSGEIKLSISVAKESLNKTNREGIEVTIFNTGIGISQEEFLLVFDKYKDMLIGKSLTQRTTGLGLAICRNIIDAHNGSISADSVMGKGSTFKILLPVETA
jgi:two-component system, OmpR family, sensor histidine kinase ResE